MKENPWKIGGVCCGCPFEGSTDEFCGPDEDTMECLASRIWDVAHKGPDEIKESKCTGCTGCSEGLDDVSYSNFRKSVLEKLPIKI